MSDEKPVVLIVGAGIGGLSAATRLIENGGTSSSRVILVDSEDYFTIGGIWQFVWTSRNSLEELKWPLSGAKLQGIDVRPNLAVTRWHVSEKSVEFSDGSSQTYDHIILATGVEPYADPIPGIENHINVCTMSTVERQQRELDELVEKAKTDTDCVFCFGIGWLPYKCPPVPFEIASLVDERLREAGVRANCGVIITCPVEWPMPPPYEKPFLNELKKRNIEWMPNKTIQKIENGVIHFEEGGTLATTLLWTNWPIRAPGFVKDAIPVDPKGFVTVDNLVTNTIPNVENAYAIGDCCTVPLGGGKGLPKAGEFAWSMGISVADAIMADVKPAVRAGNCVAELGNGAGLSLKPDFSNLVNGNGSPNFGIDVVESGGDQCKLDWANGLIGNIFGPDGRRLEASIK